MDWGRGSFCPLCPPRRRCNPVGERSTSSNRRYGCVAPGRPGTGLAHFSIGAVRGIDGEWRVPKNTHDGIKGHPHGILKTSRARADSRLNASQPAAVLTPFAPTFFVAERWPSPV